MKERWSRGTAPLELGVSAAARLLSPVLPQARVEGITQLQGGLANTNLRVDLAGGEAPLVLRLYQRDPKQAALEHALSRCLESQVTVPRFLHLAEDNPVTGQAYAVVEWIEGEQLDPVLRRLDAQEVRHFAEAIGRTLAAIHDVTFPSFGFLDADLSVSTEVDLGRNGLLDYLKTCLIEGPGAARLGEELTTALFDFAESRGHLLDDWLDRPRLVHSDFNSSNLLLRPEEAGCGWHVAVLDWEFAFSGSPAFDFGNLFRFRETERDAFGEGVTGGYAAAGGHLPDDWRHIARIADLYSWADFLKRPHANEALISDAKRAIRRTLSEADD